MPELITPLPHRRLIGPNEVAEKLGYGVTWLHRNRKKLEMMGFPPPVLDGHAFGRKTMPLRWDNRAIDLWLDIQMPEQLKRHANDERIDINAIDARAAEIRLANKARELTL